MSLGSRLKNARNQKSLTQNDAAKKLGITFQALSNYERDVRDPDTTLLKKMAELYDVTTDHLLSRTDYRTADIASEFPVPYDTARKLPILGVIRAGEPLFADENIIGYEDAPADSARNGDYFFLKVTGDSMTGPGSRIHEGDLVLVKKQDHIESGQIAVVLVNSDEATLKRVYVQGKQYILQADNPKYPPVVVPAKELKIIGRVLKGNYTL
jgi:repressor LexA